MKILYILLNTSKNRNIAANLIFYLWELMNSPLLQPKLFGTAINQALGLDSHEFYVIDKPRDLSPNIYFIYICLTFCRFEFFAIFF